MVTTCVTSLTENFLSIYCIDLQTGKCDSFILFLIIGICKTDSTNSKSSFSFVPTDTSEMFSFYGYYLLGDQYRCVKQPCNRSSPSAFLFNNHIIIVGG